MKQSSVSFRLVAPSITLASGGLFEKLTFPGDLFDISNVRLGTIAGQTKGQGCF